MAPTPNVPNSPFSAKVLPKHRQSRRVDTRNLNLPRRSLWVLNPVTGLFLIAFFQAGAILAPPAVFAKVSNK